VSAFHFSPRPNRAAEINWRPWSREAFDVANSLDRPIVLSISAVWCHWCHVMDETTYSNPGVIDIINRDYVAIRVDNDERPDINQRYNMGGWPTTAFLTPRGDILTGATYLPPDQMADALVKVHRVYRDNKPEIIGRVLEAKKRVGSATSAARGVLDSGLVNWVLQAVEGAYDPAHGGFGSAPKFPQVDAILLLAEQSVLRDREDLMRMARHTLEQMASGGTYDHVEGGFFRYSTTQDWSVPHFEKMLEDHGGLVEALAICKLPEVLDRTTGYLDRVLRDPATGLFAGSQDADEKYYALGAEEREKEQPPYVDRRVYSSWNCGLAIAYLRADARLGRPRLREHAAQALEALFDARFDPEGGVTHVEGVSGQLADQVCALLAAVRAYSAGLGDRWLERARSLADHLEGAYADPAEGGYFDHAAADGLGRLDERLKPLTENAVAALGLFELDVVLADPSAPYRRRAERALESVAALPRHYGIMAAVFARALDRLQRPPVKVTTRNPELVRAALEIHPYAVVEPQEESRAIVCIGTECLAPVKTSAELRDALRQTVG
jgi:uncharacterized protein YyaL (SSP411 family)